MCGAVVNNEFYKHLGEKWFTSEGDVIALLRHENLAKLPWVFAQIKKFHNGHSCRILDAGCGGGFLTLELARAGHECTGLDISEEVIGAAGSRDTDHLCRWIAAPSEAMPFENGSFDMVCLMDVLEHVQDYGIVLREALRVLKPDGTLLFHTFNRTWLAWLIAERGVEWFIRGAPEHLHDWKLFVKPKEAARVLKEHGFKICELRGIGPKLFSKAFAELLFTRRVPRDFKFSLRKNLQLGYLAAARLERQT
jgi:2-polyprenyl-6-hydroxyphenyl methylase/3-demethylubiquinone-9 3-methyltransferase